MALEDLTGAAKFISDLVSTNPVGSTDFVAAADDHMRGIKNVLKNTFPNINAAVTPTPAEMNALVGLAAELALINGLTSTAAELNKLDGATVTVAEINKLAGALFSTAEANHLVGVTSAIQTQLNDPSNGVLIDVQVFTVSGTWTKPGGTLTAEVWAVGGGGGGAKSLTTAAGNSNIGAGGSGGSLSYKRILSGLGATEVVTVGAAGAGGVAGGAEATSGTASTFGAHLTANPGTGPSGSATGTPPRVGPLDGTDGAAVHASADWGIPGQMSGFGLVINTAGIGWPSVGGGSGLVSFNSRQRHEGAGVTGRGADANAYGCGGDGSYSGQSTASFGGGAGAAGIIIVKSYA